jgi:hypothetical protein
MRKVGVAWRQGKRELLLVLMQEILEDNDEVACETTLNALRDLLDRTKISSDEYFSVQNSQKRSSRHGKHHRDCKLVY